MENPVLTEERTHAINGVQGRLFAVTVGGRNYKPGTFTSQRWMSESRPVTAWGDRALMRVEMRFDDQCRNGHNDFAITAEIYKPGARDVEACGCLHEEIEKYFPELAPLIKWHLTSTDAPMHYVANAVYHASNRDHWGAEKGQPYRFETVIQFGENPIKHKHKPKFVAFLQESAAHPGAERFDFEVIQVAEQKKESYSGKIEYYSKYTFGGFDAKWYECPFDTESEALDFLFALKNSDPQFVRVPTAWGEGKERDVAAARRVARWPEATDEQLSLPKAELTALLEARLPALQTEFRNDMEAAGFYWSPAEVQANA